MPLREEELAFLIRHGFTEDDVLDCTGLSLALRKAELRISKKRVVIGPACRKAGHRLRTRSNHCAQCNPAALAFQRRHRTKGFVYIAGSLTGRVVKIGGTESIRARFESLRSSAYAGLSDWELLRRVESDQYGLLEKATQSLLMSCQRVLPYVKNDKPQEATEVFACGFKTASMALDAATAKIGSRIQVGEVRLCAKRYEFP